MWRYIGRAFSKATFKITDISEMEMIKTLNEYNRAIEHISHKRYQMAELDLGVCLEIIKNIGKYGEPSYNFILTKLAYLSKLQNKHKNCEKLLEQAVKNFDAKSEFQSYLIPATEILMTQYLSTDISKCLEIGRTISKPSVYMRHLEGIAYLLKNEDYEIAKGILGYLLKEDPEQPEILHNLGYAQ